MKGFAGSTREFLLLTAVFVLGHLLLWFEAFPVLHHQLVSIG